MSFFRRRRGRSAKGIDRRVEVTRAVHAFIAANTPDIRKFEPIAARRGVPYALNCGWCEDLAVELADLFPEGQGLDSSVAAVNPNVAPYHLTPDETAFMADAAHSWFYLQGLHFDAEAPHGVRDWRDLPLFRRALRARRRRLASAGRASTQAAGVLMYHLTDRARFRLNPRFAPHDNTLAIVSRAGMRGIYLGDVGTWTCGHGYWRPFVVEVLVDPAVATAGRWGGETFVASGDFDKIAVQRVIPLDAYAREKYGGHGWIEARLGREFDTRAVIEDPGLDAPLSAHYPFKNYRYPGPDVRDMPMAEVRRLRKDLRESGVLGKGRGNTTRPHDTVIVFDPKQIKAAHAPPRGHASRRRVATELPAKVLRSGGQEFVLGPWRRFMRLSPKDQRKWATDYIGGGIREPVEVTIHKDGTVDIVDGHHRVMAAYVLGRIVPVVVSSRLPAELTEPYLDLLRAGYTPRDVNPQAWRLRAIPPVAVVAQGREAADAWIMGGRANKRPRAADKPRLLAEVGDRGAVLAAPRWIRKTIQALTRHGAVRLGTTPGGCADYTRYSRNWTVKVEVWSPGCMLAGPGGFLGGGVTAVSIDDLGADLDDRVLQYVTESAARRELPTTDWDGPLPHHTFVWEGWYPRRAEDKDHEYEAVSITVWKTEPEFFKLLPGGRGNLAPTARTAITRGGPSAPAKTLHRKKLIRGKVLDYGSGRGEDAKWLRAQGFKVTAYDPYHGPKKKPAGAYDTILVTYVLNVLPAKLQTELVRSVCKLLAPGGRAYLTARTDTCPAPSTGVQTCVTAVAGGKVVASGGGFRTWELR